MNLTEQQMNLLIDNDIIILDDPEDVLTVDDAIDRMLFLIQGQSEQINDMDVGFEVFKGLYQKPDYSISDLIIIFGKEKMELLQWLHDIRWIDADLKPTVYSVRMEYMLSGEELIFTQEGFNTLALISINTRK